VTLGIYGHSRHNAKDRSLGVGRDVNAMSCHGYFSNIDQIFFNKTKNLKFETIDSPHFVSNRIVGIIRIYVCMYKHEC